jgi:hypothetical protein
MKNEADFETCNLWNWRTMDIPSERTRRALERSRELTEFSRQLLERSWRLLELCRGEPYKLVPIPLNVPPVQREFDANGHGRRRR